ncbi:hypothetical protein AYO45_00660 [Gammaproteobacteria bacterium SCGC AG-212-F23]|nr:hypothetical protein AYO45_00660 [Gammaproteobacteria bacterium SCGC AG-212-F23]
MKKTALVILSLQKAFHEFAPLKSAVDLSLFAINSALQVFRQTSNPVFFIQHTDDSLILEGSPGFDLIDNVECKKGEYRIIKRHRNGFYQTTLAEQLKNEQVGFVVVCGLAASKCVTATVVGALENGFEAAFLQWGVADIKETLTQTPYETIPVVSTEALKYFLTLGGEISLTKDIGLVGK